MPFPRPYFRHWRPAVLVAAIVLSLLAWRLLPVESWMNTALAWVEAHGPLGVALFCIAYVPAVLLFFPDVILNMAAGMLWGVAGGTIIVSLARIAGASALFLVVRRFSAKWQKRRARQDPRFAAIMRAMDTDGFRIALMLRLSPAFPIPWVHVALGLTAIRFRTFVLTTFLGCIPRTLVAAWMGAGARTLSSLSQGPAAVAVPPWLFWGGLLVTMAVTAWLTVYARQILRAATAERAATQS